jgi:hypothetical protein
MTPAARVVPLVVSLVVSLAGPVPAVEPPGRAAADRPSPPALPPLPEGVTALQFGEFFVKPVGPRGLVLTEKIRGLDGRRVRILGSMVRRDAAPPGTLLLAPYPVQLHDHEYGLADDLPPATVTVVVPGETGELPHTPGPLLLTGRLELGSREEPDGRVSIVRLVLDPRPAGREPTPTSVGTKTVAP